MAFTSKVGISFGSCGASGVRADWAHISEEASIAAAIANDFIQALIKEIQAPVSGLVQSGMRIGCV
jgi:hypothetical protein